MTKPEIVDGAAKNYDWVEIKGCKKRVYVFPTGRVVINRPVKLNVKRKPEGDSHRIEDAAGRGHYIPPGWIHLYWEKEEGEPAFSF
jgi:hypothetical protein